MPPALRFIVGMRRNLDPLSWQGDMESTGGYGWYGSSARMRQILAEGANPWCPWVGSPVRNADGRGFHRKGASDFGEGSTDME
eukprot:993417-Alexandrium_andersonii.AAC.1